jgi:alkylation response protein AidB-like acyl-CoA dehydrogenase
LISNGAIAHVVLTFAYPEDGTKRMSAFLVDTRASGFSAEELAPKVGNPTADTAQFTLTACEVPAANRLGAEGDGLKIAMSTLVSGRLSVAAGCIGVIEDCLSEAVNYAKARHQHGKAIARHQLVQEHIAAIEMARATTETLVFSAARAKAASDRDQDDDKLRVQADLLAAQAKLHASQAACDAADRAVQVFGGRGFLEAFRPGRHLKDARVCRIYEGTDEILKLKIAAAVLGKEFEAYT